MVSFRGLGWAEYRVVPSLCQHRIVVCKIPAAFSGQGPQRVWEPTSRPRPLWPSPQPCPCPRPRPPGLPCFLAQRTLICRQPSCPGGLQGPQGATPGSAGEPRSGAHDQDGRRRVGGHGCPCAARSACSLHCEHVRGKETQR